MRPLLHISFALTCPGRFSVGTRLGSYFFRNTLSAVLFSFRQRFRGMPYRLAEVGRDFRGNTFGGIPAFAHARLRILIAVNCRAA
jgi:hypothetical protein